MAPPGHAYNDHASLEDGFDDDDVDEALFELFKKEKVRQLKSKLNTSALRDLKILSADDCTSEHTSSFQSRLQSSFGKILNYELITGISGIYDNHCTKILRKMKKDLEVLIFDLLKLFVDATSDINVAIEPKSKDHHLSTPICIKKRVADLSGVSPHIVKGHTIKKITRPQRDKVVCGRALSFDPGSSKNCVGGPAGGDSDLNCQKVAKQSTPNIDNQASTNFIFLEDSQGGVAAEGTIAHKNTPQSILVQSKPQATKKSPDLVVVKEISLIDKLKAMCNKSDKLYNQSFVHPKVTPPHASNCTGEDVTNTKKQHSSSLSFVSEVLPTKHDCAFGNSGENDAKNERFAVTAQERRFYNAVCTLASNNRYSKAIAVDIGGCNLKYFSLGDSMALGHKVCTFVVNCLCRKYFLDERPTVSLKHYFFSCVSIVLLSDSNDYSYVEKCFNGAASVLPLPLCQMGSFPGRTK